MWDRSWARSPCTAGRCTTVVYTLRTGHRRILSMRSARDAERRIHEKVHG
jgi:uncharacterized DUF497 family protein